MTRAVEVMQVIRTETIIGRGTEDDPLRPLIQFWSMDGQMLVDSDPHAPEPPKPRTDGR